MSNEELIEYMEARILTGGNRTEAVGIREVISALVESFQNLDGANIAGGFLKIDDNGNVQAPGNIEYSGAYSVSAVPTFTAGSGAGSGPTITVLGSSECGTINLTTGTGCVTGGIVVRLSIPGGFLYPNSAIGGLHANNDDAAGIISGLTITGDKNSITITCSSAAALTDSTTYKFSYTINGY